MQNKLLKDKSVGVLGPANTFSDLAAGWYIRNKLKGKAKKGLFASIWEIFDALNKGEINFGIVPIENNIHGTVRETFDCLFKSDLHILFQFSLPVRHCIAIKKGTKIGNISKIMSHQQALSQCSRYLRGKLPKAAHIAFPSTAAAIENVLAAKCGKKALICSVSAAKEHGLKIVSENIEDQKGNRTWFAVLGNNQEVGFKGKDIRTSIAFHFQKDSPGTLFGVFKDFADAKINLTKIESRPTLPKWGDYIFFLDFEGGVNAPNIKKVLKGVEKKVAVLKVFGSYGIQKVRN